MPIVAVIDGITIKFYWDEHPPPHFHAEYAERRAMIDIETLDILEGDIPKAQYRKVVVWAAPRKKELLKAWMNGLADINPGKIK